MRLATYEGRDGQGRAAVVNHEEQYLKSVRVSGALRVGEVARV
jgi:hypothetical protein